MVRLAVVGSRASAWYYGDASRLRTAIGMAYTVLEPAEVVSGQSPAGGVDTWAEAVAIATRLPFRGFPPATHDWPGYRARNEEIAQYCTHLICLTSLRARTHGAAWTADRAEELGKKVWRWTL